MNLLQAIEQAGDNWFRPVRLTGSGCAYSKNSHHTLFQCADDMPEFVDEIDTHMSALIKDLTGEWEIVTPEQVISERK